MKRKVKRDGVYLVLLTLLSLFFCWFFVGRFGVFGAKVDWISQHSVFPEYFRQQFYETGKIIPEFALNIGGGQNIYNFSYYGLFSPVVLLSYALPFVEMGDYLIVANIAGLIAAVLIFYKWLRRRGFEVQISFPVALFFLLAGPMIYHSYNQIMFVNYMPFLCMAFIGVDRYFERRKSGLYTISMFLMIMTSFYFSIGGMLVLVLYGLHRYYQEKEAEGNTAQPGQGAVAFLQDGVRFLVPMMTAVMMSAVLLVPTAMTLFGRKSGSTFHVAWQELLMPEISPEKFLYNPYGIGLTALIVVVLFTGITYRKCSERVLGWGCTIILVVPFFSYLLNGGLYIRDKAFIPFLPMLCYLTACYLRKQKNKELSFGQGMIPCLATIALWCLSRGKISNQLEWRLILLDGVLVLVCFLVFWKNRYLPVMIVPSILCLMLFGTVFHNGSGQALEQEFYESVTDVEISEMIAEAADKEKGFYRMEEYGTTDENAANLNRIWNGRQYSSSVYSSTYNEEYQKFRNETFETEQPFRNFLMQSSLANPIFRKLMGVRYVVSDKRIPGYTSCVSAGSGKKNTDLAVYEDKSVAPIVYATDCLLPEKEYEKLNFPYNQTALTHYAVADSVEEGESGWKEWLETETVETKFAIPESQQVKKTVDGYKIQTGETCKVKVPLEKEAKTIFLQFKVKNYNPKKDVSVWLEGVRNKLTKDTHIYYNGNTTFTWAAALEESQEEVEIKFGKGEYEIEDVKAFLMSMPVSNEEAFYQSELEVDWEKTKGNRIQGRLYSDGMKYVITSIPYDENFEIRVDGKKVSYGKVNTAFLGFLVGKGEHEVEIIYHAPGVAAGKIISILGFLIYIGTGFRRTRSQ